MIENLQRIQNIAQKRIVKFARNNFRRLQAQQKNRHRRKRATDRTTQKEQNQRHRTTMQADAQKAHFSANELLEVG